MQAVNIFHHTRIVTIFDFEFECKYAYVLQNRANMNLKWEVESFSESEARFQHIKLPIQESLGT